MAALMPRATSLSQAFLASGRLIVTSRIEPRSSTSTLEFVSDIVVSSESEREATVDRICLAGNPAAALGRQEQHHIGDVCRLAGTANHVMRHHLLGAFGIGFQTCLDGRRDGGRNGNAVRRDVV